MVFTYEYLILKPSKVNIMSQDLRKEMQNYPNERIINNIRQQEFFSAESVLVAQEIAIQRNLLSNEQIEAFQKISHLKEEAKNLTNKGYAPQTINQAMANKYQIDQKVANAAIYRGASESYKNRNSNTGANVIGIIFTVLIVFRIILRLATMH